MAIIATVRAGSVSGSANITINGRSIDLGAGHNPSVGLSHPGHQAAFEAWDAAGQPAGTNTYTVSAS